MNTEYRFIARESLFRSLSRMRVLIRRVFEKKMGDMRFRRRLGKLVRLKRREVERKLRETFLVVFLMGAGGHA